MYTCNLAMMYAGCVIFGVPTAVLAPWNDLIDNKQDPTVSS